MVGDAARALGALGQRASRSVRALVNTLAHEDPYVRIYAAEALASIGPKASAATKDLARALNDALYLATARRLYLIGPSVDYCHLIARRIFEKSSVQTLVPGLPSSCCHCELIERLLISAGERAITTH
jgi:HEAT repeat protein